MSDAVISSNDGIYRLLMEINNRVASVESAQKTFAASLAELQTEFEGYKTWTLRMLYAIVILLVLGALILLILILLRRILI